MMEAYGIVQALLCAVAYHANNVISFRVIHFFYQFVEVINSVFCDKTGQTTVKIK